MACIGKILGPARVVQHAVTADDCGGGRATTAAKPPPKLQRLRKYVSSFHVGMSPFNPRQKNCSKKLSAILHSSASLLSENMVQCAALATTVRLKSPQTVASCIEDCLEFELHGR